MYAYCHTHAVHYKCFVVQHLLIYSFIDQNVHLFALVQKAKEKCALVLLDHNIFSCCAVDSEECSEILKSHRIMDSFSTRF